MRAYLKLELLIGQLEELAARMRAVPAAADKHADGIAKLTGDTPFAASLRSSARSYWFELNAPDHLRECCPFVLRHRPQDAIAIGTAMHRRMEILMQHARHGNTIMIQSPPRSGKAEARLFLNPPIDDSRPPRENDTLRAILYATATKEMKQ